MPIICEFCKATFKHKRSLDMHIQKAQYCLKLREENCITKCLYCDKIFSQKLLSSHIKDNHFDIIYTENTRLKEELKNKDKTISDLQQMLKDIAVEGVKKSSVNIQQNVVNLKNLSPEDVKNTEHLLTENILRQCIPGLAKFAADHPFKNKAICTDSSRYTFKYKNSEGKVVKDSKGTLLAKMFLETLEEGILSCIEKAEEQIKLEIERYGTCQKALDIICRDMNELNLIKAGVKKVSIDDEVSLKDAFTRNLSKFLPAE